eukprot:TRINITY_DN2452_c0_g1_i7.p1 TRINITY_DN2452_c0_g1~~TRINITY_DN2452_c0_g1_i7.p1  ORF type:complete len:396 (+),score=74.15 TRINITY_DN2452_c0_g1_i7:306-1493(+)
MSPSADPPSFHPEERKLKLLHLEESKFENLRLTNGSEQKGVPHVRPTRTLVLSRMDAEAVGHTRVKSKFGRKLTKESDGQSPAQSEVGSNQEDETLTHDQEETAEQRRNSSRRESPGQDEERVDPRLIQQLLEENAEMKKHIVESGELVAKLITMFQQNTSAPLIRQGLPAEAAATVLGEANSLMTRKTKMEEEINRARQYVRTIDASKLRVVKATERTGSEAPERTKKVQDTAIFKDDIARPNDEKFKFTFSSNFRQEKLGNSVKLPPIGSGTLRAPISEDMSFRNSPNGNHIVQTQRKRSKAPKIAHCSKLIPGFFGDNDDESADLDRFIQKKALTPVAGVPIHVELGSGRPAMVRNPSIEKESPRFSLEERSRRRLEASQVAPIENEFEDKL